MQDRYFLAGAAAMHAPFLSAPPFGSHFIFAFTQSALVVGAACANTVGASRSEPISAITGRSFIVLSLRLVCRSTSIQPLPERLVNGREAGHQVGSTSPCCLRSHSLANATKRSALIPAIAVDLSPAAVGCGGWI